MITLNFKSFEDMEVFAKKVVGQVGSPVESVGNTKETMKKETVKKEEVKKEDTVKKEEVIKLEDVRAVLAKLTRSGKTKEVKELLNELGASKLTDINADDYPVLMEKAGGL